jgi:glycosyltransferase involved in cell wall biosynthesis
MWSKRGFQVLLSVYNAEGFIKRCFDSLNYSLKDEDWILLIGNDSSTDNTILEITEYMPQSSAKKVHVFDYPKALNVGEAKNRVIREAHNFKNEYPAILMMDADDEMTPERPKMIETAIEEQSAYVVGAWNRFKRDLSRSSGWKKQSSRTAGTAAKNLQFGPWATLFHCDFLPPNGVFFPEDKVNNCGYEDLLTWHYLETFNKKTPTAHTSDTPVHFYYIHEESVSNGMDQNRVTLQRNTYWALLNMIKEYKLDIFSAPPTEQEVTNAIARFIAEKKRRKHQRRSSTNKSLVVPVHPLDQIDLFKPKK